MKIVCHHSDRNLGARNIDDILVDILGGEFYKKYGADPRKNFKCRLRMLDAIEKQRKILSANLEATVHLEALMEDEDLHRNIKRPEFEEMI
jgi:molecular chaperone DnaK (HSP70)